MSAAGRTEGVRRDHDHYVTPPWAVHRFLESYEIPRGATVLDPCAADGGLLAAIHEVRPDLVLMASEIREECRAPLSALLNAGVIVGFWLGDFFDLAPGVKDNDIDVVLTNPPFNLAVEFINECNRIARLSNVHLVRLNFLGALKRHDWIAKHKPGVIVSANRPYFTGWGGDATEYAWLVYKDQAVRGVWDITAVTPEKMIQEWNAIAREMFPEANPKLRLQTPAPTVEALIQ